MSGDIGKVDVNPDKDGTFLVHFKNRHNLLFDGLLDLFGIYGKVSSIVSVGGKNFNIKFKDKESALKCYQDLNKTSAFQVELPHKYYIEDFNEDEHMLKEAEEMEASIKFNEDRVLKSEGCTENNNEKKVLAKQYMYRRRRLINSQVFKRFIICLGVCNQYSQPLNGRMKFLKELKLQLKGVNLRFERGFLDEIKEGPYPEELPYLVLAKDVHYFKNVEMVNAVDVLVCNLPPWYKEVDLHKLLFRLAPDNYLGADWHRYPADIVGVRGCTFPFAIVYVKTFAAACKLRYSVDGTFIDFRQISVCLMDDIENMLADVVRGCC